METHQNKHETAKPKRKSVTKRQADRIRKMVSVTLSPDVIELLDIYVEATVGTNKSGVVEDALLAYLKPFLEDCLKEEDAS